MRYFIALFFIINSFAYAGGDWVGNGASFSENMFLLAFENIEQFVGSCLKDSECIDQAEQKLLLEKIYRSLPTEKKQNPIMIQFLNQSPIFIIDGQVKVAVTGLKTGDSIYINRDYLNGLNYPAQGVSLAQCISILVHELGHHQGIMDHTYLDQLGAKVSKYAQLDARFLSIDPRFSNIGAQLVVPKKIFEFSSTLALVDSDKFIDLTEKLNKLASCPNKSNQKTKKKSINFWNVSWINPLSYKPQLFGYVALRCVDIQGKEFDWIGDRFSVFLSYLKQDNKVIFNEKEIRFEFKSCDPSHDECNNIYKFLNQKKQKE